MRPATSIFYADDDIDDLDFFKEVTAELNEPVTLFEEGSELLSSLQNPPPQPSVVFLDLNMPVKSGFDVLNEIRSTPSMKELPVIILTTSTNPADIKSCKELGANLYMRKPTSSDALQKAIIYVLAKDWKTFVASDKEFLYQH